MGDACGQAQRFDEQVKLLDEEAESHDGNIEVEKSIILSTLYFCDDKHIVTSVCRVVYLYWYTLGLRHDSYKPPCLYSLMSSSQATEIKAGLSNYSHVSYHSTHKVIIKYIRWSDTINKYCGKTFCNH